MGKFRATFTRVEHASIEFEATDLVDAYDYAEIMLSQGDLDWWSPDDGEFELERLEK